VSGHIATGELDAAGIPGERLRAAYLECRALNARHGKTYYLATLLLPPAKRPAVHALYGFARWVDDVVDEGTGPVTVAAQQALIDDVQALLEHSETDGASTPAVVVALRDAMRRWQLPMSYFLDFLASMRMDLSVTEYETYADLERYMWGSAAVIGLQMLPVLEPVTPLAIAAPYAVDLGVAFQLTNFLRDVGDDLRRGRIYLPLESLRRHGVDRARLERGVVDGPIRRLLADEIARTRELYRSAAVGVRMLHPTSRDCVRTALRLYGGILDEIERSDYRVLDRRVRVGTGRRLAVAGPGAARALLARRRS
jgi:15-cis-phytoene synthase